MNKRRELVSVNGLMSHVMRAFRSCLAIVFFAMTSIGASSHPHVWVTMRTKIVFNPNGQVTSVVHDWVFDEMYSSFATQGLAKPGELVRREVFAPLALENASSLAEIGYYTTLKLDGKAVEFGSVTEYWMEERADHLVAFHVVMPLKTPTPIGRFGSLFVADPTFYIDFEFDDKDGVALVSAPNGCSTSYAKPKPLEGTEKKKLDESFFSGLAPGADFGLKMASRIILACP